MEQKHDDSLTLTHVGLCVYDLAAAVSFYIEVFGFDELRGLELKNDCHALLGQEGDFHLVSKFLRRDHIVIELLSFIEPKPVSSTDLRPMNALGFTHLSFRTHHLEQVLGKVVLSGGRVMHETRTQVSIPGSDASEIIFVLDPSGTRIELVQIGRSKSD